jgi:hypothetical protein
MGERLEKHEDIGNELRNHFSQLLIEPLEDRQEAIHNITSCIPYLISHEQNIKLMRVITHEEEVSQIVIEMASGKSLGLDGFTIDFF